MTVQLFASRSSKSYVAVGGDWLPLKLPCFLDAVQTPFGYRHVTVVGLFSLVTG